MQAAPVGLAATVLTGMASHPTQVAVATTLVLQQRQNQHQPA